MLKKNQTDLIFLDTIQCLAKQARYLLHLGRQGKLSAEDAGSRHHSVHVTEEIKNQSWLNYMFNLQISFGTNLVPKDI